MDSFLTILFIVILFFVSGGVIFFWLKKSKLDEKQSEAIKELNKQISEIKGKLEAIGESVSGSSKTMLDQVSSFTEETTQVRENLKRIQEEMKNISSFQEIFRTPKLRGEWGEASLEHILAEYFPPELYIINHKFSTGDEIEAVLKLPNKRLLPIDAKFFSDNFEKMVEARSEEERDFFTKKFITDIKFNIDKIASKYILPSENTVDFALMYIPAEAIYYEMMFNLKEENIDEYARKKRVIPTSPNTFYLTVRTIEHWFKDTQISRETRKILDRLNRVQKDAEKLMNDFRKLGSHLRNATSAYDASEKRLSLFTERVERLIEPNQSKQLEEK
ncbi:DNA recombination protein RmuC [bacterium]|nr:DNA recombination protein RmuC [bacterium]